MQAFTDKVIDYVLVYKDSELDNPKRIAFEKELKNYMEILGTEMEHQYNFIKLHVPWEVLFEYAEINRLRMPLNLEELVPLKNKFSNFLVGRRMRHLKLALKKNAFPRKQYAVTAEFSRERQNLFDKDNSEYFDPATRIMLAKCILNKIRYGEGDFDEGIDTLISDKVYINAFPMHDGMKGDVKSMRNQLLKHWGSLSMWKKVQPLGYVKNYFGEAVALYYSWFGFYNFLLAVPALIGFIVVIFSAIWSLSMKDFSTAVCESNYTMCPLCDTNCRYWQLKDVCFYTKFNFLADNGLTVIFCILMTAWSSCYNQYWMRYLCGVAHRWGMANFDLISESARVKYVKRLAKSKHVKYKTNFITRTPEPMVPFWRLKLPILLLSYTTILFLCLIVIGVTFSITVYRMTLSSTRVLLGFDTLTKQLIVPATSGLISLLLMMLLDVIYQKIVHFITRFELHRTESALMNSIAVKIYIFQFINYYSSIFYVAFVKGRLVGYPGKYTRIFGKRLEECHPAGCMIELSMQLAMTMVGRQLFYTFKNFFTTIIKQSKLFNMYFYKRDIIEQGMASENHFIDNYNLLESHELNLVYQYLNKTVQFGFLTLFVSAFPLAPFCALLNNLIEIRLEAKMLLKYYKRPAFTSKRFLGVWASIIQFIHRFSILTNACIIAFTSTYVQKIVYTVETGDYYTGAKYLEYSLSKFDTRDYPEEYTPRQTLKENITFCYYYAFRHPPSHLNKYTVKREFWHVVASRLIFIITYVCLVGLIDISVEHLIMKMPSKLFQKIHQEEIIVRNLLYQQRRNIDSDTDGLPFMGTDFSQIEEEDEPQEEVRNEMSSDEREPAVPDEEIARPQELYRPAQAHAAPEDVHEAPKPPQENPANLAARRKKLFLMYMESTSEEFKVDDDDKNNLSLEEVKSEESSDDYTDEGESTSDDDDDNDADEGRRKN